VPELFDSHLHLTDGRFREDLPRVIRRAREAGVREMVTVGTDPEDARAALELARAHEGIWATAGLHPHEALRFDGRILSGLRRLVADPRVVAVGETGLDYHYDHSPRARQRDAFRAQMELARETGLPAVVHSREADADTAGVIEEFAGEVAGVLHCFTGGLELLETAVGAGWYVSFSGIATFASFEAGERVERVPDDRLLVESDSPYLAPEPERGKRNEPAFVVHTCRFLARTRGEPLVETAARTRGNARRFYRLDGSSR